MIVVDITLKPGGFGTGIGLGQVKITNDATQRGARGSYNVCLYSRGDNPRLIRTARVENWPRNAQPAWRLIAAAFAALESVGNKVDPEPPACNTAVEYCDTANCPGAVGDAACKQCDPIERTVA